MIGYMVAMKKWIWLPMIILLGVGVSLFAQEQKPPPLYDTTEDTGEPLPPDLAIEKLPPKPKPKPQLEEKPVEEPKAAEPKPEEEAAPKIQVEKEIELPSAPPAVPEPPKAPEVIVPSDLPVVKPPAEIVGPATPDAGPLKDAGGDLQTALVVTFTQYENNFLSPEDPVDVFQVYTRALEGVGVILKPKHPSSQLVCDLLGKDGELLSQTQASAAGQTLSFQTSPFKENSLLYLRLKDMNLAPESPLSELREYSLELRPLAAVQPPPPAPLPPQLEEPQPKAPPAEKRPEPTTPLWQNEYVQYGVAGFLILVLGMVLLGLIRRRKKS